MIWWSLIGLSISDDYFIVWSLSGNDEIYLMFNSS